MERQNQVFSIRRPFVGGLGVVLSRSKGGWMAAGGEGELAFLLTNLVSPLACLSKSYRLDVWKMFAHSCDRYLRDSTCAGPGVL